MKGISHSDRQLVRATKDLVFQWDATGAGWHDQARADFEKVYIDEIRHAAKSAVDAMTEINRLLGKAIDECS
ncbi:MAG: hypothetical protein M5U26_16000 [Planctomycetota bacterium]|nr:hypothetical protein [Planctomycetota bacterium]